MLTQPGWQADILDLDTYGSPWKHYNAMLPNLSGPLTVFLTIGQYQMGIDANIAKDRGLNGLRPPPAILMKISLFP